MTARDPAHPPLRGPRPGRRRFGPGWWALGAALLITAVVVVTLTSFRGTFARYVDVTVTSPRAGLTLEPGSKVKFRGVEVGHVADVGTRPGGVTVDLDLDPRLAARIPASVVARIRATTVFGAKYVDLDPTEPVAAQHITSGARLTAVNVTTEVNTVFDNLVSVLDRVDPPKLNAVLTAWADGLRGKGARIGEATAAARNVVAALDDRSDVFDADLRSLSGATGAYAAAAPNLLATLTALSTTSSTVTGQARELDAALLATAGLSQSGIDLLGPNMDNLVNGINNLQPTTDLLAAYEPEYTCTLQGAYWLIQNGAYDTAGGDGRTAIVDVGVGFAQDPYRFPDNLPKVNAKGGPDGRPGCGSLPRPDLKFPIRALVTDTGYGTGLDWRPNPGIAHPYGENFLPVTKANPEPPRVWGDKPPAIGPVPYPGAPPYGAPLFGSDGQPLWAPPPPGSPPPPVPGVPNPPPPYGTGPVNGSTP